MKHVHRITWILLFALLPFQSVTQGIWTARAAFGGGAVSEARAFSIGNYGYFGGPNAMLWRYDPSNDIWTQMADLSGPGRLSPVAFSIDGKGYLGTGGSLNDFYEYDTTTNAWTQLSNFGGAGREGAVGIAISGKGYVGTGGNYLADWWEFDPLNNSWTQKANLGGPGRYHAGAFSINGKGYVCAGFNGSFMNDLLEYDPVANTWTPKATMPGTTRDRPVGIATAFKGYLISGWDGGTALADAWEYDPVSNGWTSLTTMPTAGRYNSCGFSITDKVYIGTGYMNGLAGDFWEYGPDCSALLLATPTSCALACDGSASVLNPTPGAVASYLWSNGQTAVSATGLCAGTHTVTVTDTTGCTSINMVTVPGPPPIQILATPTLPLCFGDSNGMICINVAGGNQGYTFLWFNGDTSACLQQVPAGSYSVTVTDSTGCQGSLVTTLNSPAQLGANIIGTDATCATCPNGSAVIQVVGGTSPMTYLWSTGATLAFENNLLPGVYTCCVTDFNGCTTCDSVVINFPSGLADMESVNIKVAPNPFAEQFSFESELSCNEIEDAWLVDIIGRKVSVRWTCDNNKVQVHTNGLKNGNYVLLVQSVSDVHAIRIEKKE